MVQRLRFSTSRVDTDLVSETRQVEIIQNSSTRPISLTVSVTVAGLGPSCGSVFFRASSPVWDTGIVPGERKDWFDCLTPPGSESEWHGR